MSIGASPGIQFITKFEKITFSDYDFVFFDSIPNDQTYHDQHLVKYDKQNIVLFHKITFEIIKRIASQTKLIVLCIDEKNISTVIQNFTKIEYLLPKTQMHIL